MERLQMENKNTRVPKQKRSIEKKEKIIEAAYEIFSRDGYFGTNTAQIAKEAGLSTGSVYAYFNDKKDILLECLYKYGDNLTQEIAEKIDALTVSGDIFETVRSVLLICAKYHSKRRPFHDDVMSLQFRDEDINQYFINIREKMSDAIVKHLEKSEYAFRNEREQTYLMFQMVSGIEDELAFNHSPGIDPDILVDECANSIISMLVKK
jgi:TetR/AcrR family transcriptional regulator, biofilm operon repressor